MITIKYSPIVLGLMLCSCHTEPDAEQPVVKQPVYSSLAVQQDGKETGHWGYVVFKDDKLLVEQFTIPAIEGNRHFSGKEQAALVGNLVAEKLNHAKRPGITKKELDSLGIIPLHDADK